MKVNYDLKMEEILKEISESGKKKRLLIHSCCGPCSSSVLEYLKDYFKIDIYYYNPNITFDYEYWARMAEQKEMLKKLDYDMNVIEGIYNPKEDFFEKIKGFENEKEGGQRCYSCYDINYINEIGEKYSKEYDIPFLFADFKKKNRYLRSVQISKELNMYRQEYCGCVFSKVEKEQRDREKVLKEKQEGEVKND